MSDNSKYIYQPLKRLSLNDLSGNEDAGSMLRSLIYDEEANQIVDIGKASAVMLCGPEGSGRHTMLKAMAGEYAANGYKVLQLDIKRAGKCIPSEFIMLAKQILASGKCLVLLNGIEELSDGYELGALMEYAEQCKNALMIAAAAYDPGKISLSVGCLFTPIYLKLPSEQSRRFYFKNAMPEIPTSFRNEMVTKTDGCGYDQLAHLILRVRLNIKNRYTLGILNDDNIEDEIMSAVREAIDSFEPYIPAPKQVQVAVASASPAPVNTPEPKPMPQSKRKAVSVADIKNIMDSIDVNDIMSFPDPD